MDYNFVENLILDRGFNLTLTGGFDNSYSNNTNGNPTTPQGSLFIKSGSLTVDKLNIQ